MKTHYKNGILNQPDLGVCGRWEYSTKDSTALFKLTELKGCCAIHEIFEIYTNSVISLQILIDKLLPEVKLLIVTHNETQQGDEIRDQLKACGFKFVDSVWSNHNYVPVDADGNNRHDHGWVRMYSLRGTKPNERIEF